MVEPGHQQRFSLKSIAKLGIRSDVVVHNLDDNFSSEVELSSEIDAAHAAFSKKASGFVTSQKHSANHAQSRWESDLD
jgi:hypothetical protein